MEGQIQRMRHAALNLIGIMSRDDLFRHLLSQTDSAQGQKIVSTTYWRTCSFLLTIATRHIHQSDYLHRSIHVQANA